MTTVRVDYTRTVSQAGSYSSTKIGGSVDLIVGEGDDWQKEWGAAHEALKTLVDAAASHVPAAPAAASVLLTPPAATAPSDQSPTPDATPEVSQEESTFAVNQPVTYTDCRVMYPSKEYAAQGKRREHVRLRIGNQDQIPVGQGYVDLKSEDPNIMSLLRMMRPADMVNVQGAFEKPWFKKDDTQHADPQYCLVVEEIIRA